MSKRQNWLGRRVGRLTVIEYDEEKSEKYKKPYWICKCDCGNTVSVSRDNLASGNTNSCGCLHKELLTQRNTKHNKAYSRIYHIWLDMRQRCYNPKNHAYKHYGERGIRICNEWDDFTTFYNWAMVNGYEDDLTIDRINNDGNYEPSNCRWVNRSVQMNNTRCTVFLNIDGEKLSLKAAIEKYAPTVKYGTVKARYYREGFQSVEQLFRDKAS